jgi:hypothetical protein
MIFPKRLYVVFQRLLADLAQCLCFFSQNICHHSVTSSFWKHLDLTAKHLRNLQNGERLWTTNPKLIAEPLLAH